MSEPATSPRSSAAVAAVRNWTPRHWLAAGLGAVVIAIAVGVPTDVIPNPVFGRPVAVTWWSYPVLAATAALGGLLVGSYVRFDGEREPESERAARTGGVAGLLSFFAVGCPVCNKLVLLAVGTTGARQWFEPLQPALAVVSLILLGYALWFRLSTMTACPVPPSRSRASR